LCHTAVVEYGEFGWWLAEYWGRRERHTVLRWGNVRGGGHFENTGLVRWIIIK
jgi:hypothetical protein